jgi:hypothetical protein
MLNIVKPSKNRVDIELDGTLDAQIMRDALDSLIAKSADVENGRMLYTITNFSLPTLGALGVELGRLPSLFALIGKFEKCAVVSDLAWVRKAADIEGALFPGIDIKSFEDKQPAEAWLAGDH